MQHMYVSPFYCIDYTPRCVAPEFGQRSASDRKAPFQWLVRSTGLASRCDFGMAAAVEEVRARL
jgi:hypothetical protein